MTGDDIEGRIASVLEGLPVLEEMRPRINQQANRLAWVFELSVAFGERPAAQLAGEKKAAAEVDKLAALAIEFANHVDRMHRNSLAVFEGADCRHPMRLAEQLWKVAEVAAKTSLQPQASRPRKAVAAETAKQALIAYKLLTGKKATITVPALGGKARGTFLKFVTELFAVLDIKASPENWARNAIESLRRKQASK